MDAHKRLWKELGFPGDYVTHTHSTPIQIAMDRGLPALVCYVWLMAMIFALVWRGYTSAKRNDDAPSSLMLGAFAALIGFSASSLVNYNFGDAETLMMLLLIIGLAIVASEKQSRQSEGSEAYAENQN
jgi:O-antigen ligase